MSGTTQSIVIAQRPTDDGLTKVWILLGASLAAIALGATSMVINLKRKLRTE